MALHVEMRGDHVRVVTLDRPERRNALDPEALDALEAAVADAEAAGVRVLVVRGAGGHFCSGADLTGVEGPEFAAHLNRVLTALRDTSFPTIAAVEGAALGAGTQLALACDLRTATSGASFGIPAAKLGLMVDHWTVARLVREAGYGAAREMLLAAGVIDGERAERLGIVQRLCTPDEALAWADEVATKAPLTISGHKLMINRLEDDPSADSDVHRVFHRAWESADFAEGLAAFRERRNPTFEGR